MNIFNDKNATIGTNIKAVATLKTGKVCDGIGLSFYETQKR